jgi:hypothetical protein
MMSLPKGLAIARELSFQQPIAVLIPSQQREAIIKQTQALYCAGFIKYNDIFGHEWTLATAGNTFPINRGSHTLRTVGCIIS